jgi:GEVED domain
LKNIILFILVVFGLQASAQTSCATALPLTINGPCLSSAVISDTTQDLPLITNSCGTVTFKEELWYTFTVTGGPLTIKIKVDSVDQNLYLQLISSTASCTGLTQIACANSDTAANASQTETITQLLPNGIYYLKVINVGTGASMSVDNLCVTSIITPCTSITNIAACGTTTTVAIPAGTGSYSNLVCGSASPGGEKIYTFTPTVTGPYTIQQNSSYTNINYQFKAVSGGCSGTGWTCIANLLNAATSGTFVLTAGTQYYIMLDPLTTAGGSVSFSITCSAPIIFNDDCINATILGVNPSNTCAVTATGNTTNATESLAGCSGTADDDVWYQFTATNSTHIVTVTPNTLSNAVFEVFDGTCGSFVSILCQDLTVGSAVETSPIDGLTVGNIYYVRVHSAASGSGQGSFTICVATPPNPCSSVTPIDNCGTTINQTIPAGYGSYSNYTCGNYTPGVEHLYIFTPNTSGNYYIQQNSAFGPIDYQIKLVDNGCNENGWDCISSLTGPSLSPYIYLVGGNEYYIMIDPTTITGGIVNFTLACAPTPPANNECTGAINLTTNPTAVCATSTNATSIGATESQPGCSGTADDDVWFQFTATSSTHIITVTPNSMYDAVFEVFDGTCTGGLSSLLCNDNTTGTAVEGNAISGLTIGNTYYVRVYSNPANAGFGTFNICVTTPVNPCISITPIVACNTTINATITAGFGSYANSACGNLTNGKEKIYSFTPTTDGSYTISQISSFGAIDYQIKEASLGCDEYNWNCMGSLTSAATSPYYTLTAGVEYYILADPQTSTGGNFSFSITCGVIPPANDEPCNATPLNVTLVCNYDTFSNTNASSSQFVGDPSCANYVNNDVWFSVVVPSTGMVIIDTQVGNVTNSGIAVYEGDCSLMNEIACDDNSSANPLMSSLTVSMRTPGEVLYIRLWQNGGGSSGTFGICVTTPPVCSEPTAQATNYTNGTITSSSVSASFTGAASGYLIIQSTSNIPPLQPVNGVTYSAFNIVDLGLNYIFIDNSTTPNFTSTGVTGNTHYYYYIYAYNNTNCAGPVYSSIGPLTGNATTCVTAPISVATNNVIATGFTLNWFAPIGGNALPITYTIQVTSDAGYTVNVPGSPFTVLNPTNVLNVTGLAINTYYYYRILASTSVCSSAYVTGTVFTGYCSSTSTTATRYITSFSTTGGTTNINNTASGYSPSGYGAFLSQIVTKQIYGTVNFAATFFNGTFAYGFNIWVDWNDDLDFNDAGEKVYASGALVTAATGSFAIPGTAPIGQHRMRIKADTGTFNPTPCGTITNGETEDYTLEVTPLTCSGNPSNLTSIFTSQTTATVSWTAPTPAPAGGYQYYFSTSAVTPSYLSTPTGSVGAGVTSINFTGLFPSYTYYVWVRSYCDAINGSGIWIGPVSFSQLNCTTGNGIGTSTVGCPSVIAGGLGLNGADPAPINGCATTGCVDLEAQYLHLGDTSNYTVQSIPYAPPYQYGCMANPISINIDDVWSPVINLPFNFCFYGTNYSKCLVSSNGALTFDTVSNVPSGYSAWSFNSSIPSASLFKNTIFGVYQDINPALGGSIGWELITLNTGCRALVASWKNIPMYSCSSTLYTGMMVLYENTNIIEVYIEQKNLCSSWNFGNAIVGVQNATGSQAVVAPSRNGLDADWTATNEAWRFVPSGSSLTSIKWHQGAGTAGPIVGTTDVINVCPTATTTYTAEVTYALCNGTTLVETDQTTVSVSGNKTWNGSVSTNWNTAANWTPVGIPTGIDCVIVPVTANNPIISGTNYTGLAGTLSVLNNATLTVNSGNNITVTDWVMVQPSGLFQLENSSNLIQINNVQNTGNILYKRNATVRNQDYVYWASPVANYNVNNIVAPLVPNTVFSWNTTVANTNGGQGNWENAAGSTMIAGKGYIAKSPSSFSSTVASTLFGSFTGVPNNGNITVPIYRGTDVNTLFHAGNNGIQITNFSDNWNLLGNPYPSSISGSQFLFNNNTKIIGNIKLWTHGTLPSVIASPFYGTFGYNYTPGDYLTYNFTGTSCCPAAPADLYIGAGQGYFVQMVDGAASSDTVSFSNGMRNATYTNSTFYKTATPMAAASMPTIQIDDLERHRIWLDLVNSANSQSDRMLVGYVEGATNDEDSYFDAETMYMGCMSLFSMIGTDKYLIQGRQLPFDKNDVIPLGVTIATAGKHSIGLGAIDGLFNEPVNNIYLEDKQTHKIHNLKIKPYTFSAPVGTFTNRFKLRFKYKGDDNDDEEDDDKSAINSSLNLVKSGTEMNITSTNEIMNTITVYDLVGRELYKVNNIQSQSFTITDVVRNNQALVVKITLTNGITVTKKVLF